MINAEEHLGLAKMVVARYCNNMRGTYTNDELLSTAYLGLVRAIRNFDESKGYKFSSYAVPYILGFMRTQYRDDRWYQTRDGKEITRHSIDLKNSDDCESTYHDVLEDEFDFTEEVLADSMVFSYLSVLNEKEKVAVVKYHLEGYNQTDTAKFLGVHQSRVSKILHKAVLKLKRSIPI